MTCSIREALFSPTISLKSLIGVKIQLLLSASMAALALFITIWLVLDESINVVGMFNLFLKPRSSNASSL